MNRSLRFGTALSALAISATVTGCAIGRSKPQSAQAFNADKSKIGLATKAQAALEAGQYELAVSLAEQAVDGKPRDPGFRALLANIYFAAGRFASAESAYRDALSLDPSQLQLPLKLALAQIAQGKNANALGVLQGAQGQLEAADYGLAIALAGLPEDAVAVLNQAARQPNADGRVRQNLALAYGLTGDWGMARTVAAQDIAPEKLDSTLHQWMQMAKPTRSSDQVAALTGVKPVADPGQPVRLALVRPAETNVRSAQVAAPQPQIAAVAQPTQELAAVALPPVAPLSPVPAAEPLPMEQPQVTAALFADVPAPVEKAPVRFDDQPKTASYVAISKNVRKAAAASRANGKADAVVQLGAYGSPQRVAAAWNTIARRHPTVNRYNPMSARFDAGSGTVYRLSVKGFASSSEAQKLCGSLRSNGQSCFVRRIAGDAPVRFASR